MKKRKNSVIAMIPARKGSTRLRLKNLALLNGKPLIVYAIEAAKASGAFDRIVVNADDTMFEEISGECSVEFYLRPERLGSSNTKSDAVIYDFMSNYPSEIVAWVNPTSPLQTGKEIKKVVAYFKKNRLDTLITVKDENVHCVHNNKPVNFKPDELFARTQDLGKVQCFVYSVMMWNTKKFMSRYEKKGFAFFTGKVGYFPVSRETSIIIKNKEDLALAEMVLKAEKSLAEAEISYYGNL